MRIIATYYKSEILGDFSKAIFTNGRILAWRKILVILAILRFLEIFALYGLLHILRMFAMTVESSGLLRAYASRKDGKMGVESPCLVITRI